MQRSQQVDRGPPDHLLVEHMGFLGRLAHLFDGDRIEIGEKGFARLAHGRIDHPLEQDRVCAQILRIAVLSDIAVRTISPIVIRRRSRAS